ncbi:Bacteriocin-protection, YdeI or OmpD-Associated [Paenimyroides ummariense]|uniref:Bacteriocin-protection, YdeI or OmpD-Associated n=1 Tax=Paenimyroides ummariense TaxID=913024 RepID=A0A1I5GWD0_9FLAO|nr:Bacteriocin-protection, YdeI or OmpD-Associated [Paenimyroides ummariense]
MFKFKAQLEIIGINPFVYIPDEVLDAVFKEAGRNKGPIPINGTINEKAYTQTLVRFKGAWRLYINTIMLSDSPRRIGEYLDVTIKFDPLDRSVEPHPDFALALQKNKTAEKVFLQIPPFLRKEIIRYINSLKTPEKRAENIEKAIGFLLGKNKFIGRDKLNAK